MGVRLSLPPGRRVARSRTAGKAPVGLGAVGAVGSLLTVTRSFRDHRRLLVVVLGRTGLGEQAHQKRLSVDAKRRQCGPAMEIQTAATAGGIWRLPNGRSRPRRRSALFPVQVLVTQARQDFSVLDTNGVEVFRIQPGRRASQSQRARRPSGALGPPAKGLRRHNAPAHGCAVGVSCVHCWPLPEPRRLERVYCPSDAGAEKGRADTRVRGSGAQSQGRPGGSVP